MQAVFVAADRADREYHSDPLIAKQLATLKAEVGLHQSKLIKIKNEINKKGGDKLVALDKQLESLRKQSKTSNRPEFGYHSQISAKQDVNKWVQEDLPISTDVAWDEVSSNSSMFEADWNQADEHEGRVARQMVHALRREACKFRLDG